MSARPRLFLLLLIITVFTGLYSAAAPVAGFNIITPITNCNPTIYSFVSTSTGAGLSYRWNFGVYPGTNSIFPNPSTTYLNCGVYQVKLVVTDSIGRTDSNIQTVNIRCSPRAQFTTSGVAGCVPLTGSFTSTSLPGTGAITSYVWDFGDGNGGSGSNPSHTYLVAGCKNVTLIVTNTYNCTSDTTINNLLCAYQTPHSAFTSTSSTSCTTGLTINYTAGSSSGLAPYAYRWLFPGGTPSTSNVANPAVVYNSSGQFNATLITTDAHGCADTVVKPNYVFIAGNALDFTFGTSSFCAPSQVLAHGISTPLPISWRWTITHPATVTGDTTPTPNFAFPDSGNYTICVTANYLGGCVAQKCTTVVIKPSPKAYFTASGAFNTCVLPNPITFTDSSSGNGLTYIWNFQGGVPASFYQAAPPVVVYDTCGTYFAGLTVTDINGCKNTYVKPGFLQIVCNPAVYTVSPSIGCIPLTSNFNSTGSAGNPVAWVWDFDDPTSGTANSSTLQNPSHTFQNDGCYNVKLTTINAQGCASYYQLPAAVCCGYRPHANFSGNPPINCINQPFYFTDSSTNTYEYTGYFWDFHNVPPYVVEDTAQNPVYTYYDVGTYNITLIVSNYGCGDTITKDDYVQTVYPLSVPQVIRNCDNPLTVTLDGSASLGAQILKWLIPGGSPDSSTSAIVVATYPGPGDYSAYLYVQNDSTGCSDLESVVVHITGVGAQFSASPLNGCTPMQSCFTSTSSNVTHYNWTAINSLGVVDTTASTEAPCFKFKNAGIYSVLLIVSDTFGCIDTVYKPDYIRVSHPLANLTATPITGCAPLAVTFADSTVVPFSAVEKWNWNFGDITSGAADSSALQSPLHTFNLPGTYSIRLSIVDSNGCTSSKLRTAYIKANKPDVTFSEINTPLCNGLQSCYTTTTVNTGLQYHWNFGDGQTADSANLCHLFTTQGPFQISLVVTDASQCTDTAFSINNSNVVFPNPSFVASDTFSSCPPLSVSFTNLSTNFDSATAWRWEFGDGQVSSLKNPFHIYTVGGIFSVTLIASNPGGCNDTLVYTDYIKITGPSAHTATAPTSGCVPHSTCMSAVSTGTNTYIWNFGDGTVLPGADSVCYTYIRTGTFYPELILNDGLGCVFSLPLGRVDVTGTVAHFKLDTAVFCGHGTVHFVDSSYGSSAAQSWNWNFGDPTSGAQNTSSLQNPAHLYAAPGTYRVAQNIQSTDGCTDSTAQYITVTPAPSVTITVGNTSACAPDSVQLNSQISSVLPIGTILWQFGDSASTASNTSTLQNPVHYYSHPGSYTISITISDTNGCVGVNTAPLLLRQRPLAAYSAFDKCFDKQPFVFINNSQFANTYSWTFGDGTQSALFAPSKTYADTGAYAVQLIASNSFCSDTVIKTLTVFSIPDAAFTPSANGLCGPAASFQLTNTSTNASSFVWNLGNNTTSGLINPVADFTAPGTYTIALTAISANGCKDNSSTIVTVYPKPDVLSLDISPAEGCTPLQVSFSANASYAAVYNWNFGTDSANLTTTVGTASYTYRDTGTFSVSVSVSSIHQCSDSLVLKDTVKVHLIPVAIFDTLINSSVYPYDGTIVFLNQSTNADTYTWDFGDGQTTHEFGPSHTYEKIDVYTVLLVASTKYGCADSATISVNIIKKSLHVPNALQPDFKGSEELVKVWKPLGIGLLKYRAQVFDKWGTLMWESTLLSETIPAEGWDGTYLGKPCPQDAYVWKISAEFLDGTVWKGITYDKDEGGGQKTIGSITLVR